MDGKQIFIDIVNEDVFFCVSTLCEHSEAFCIFICPSIPDG